MTAIYEGDQPGDMSYDQAEQAAENYGREPVVQQHYLTEYQVDDGPVKAVRVSITPGYSTFEDLRKILAIRELSSNEPDAVARITVVSAFLHGR